VGIGKVNIRSILNVIHVIHMFVPRRSELARIRIVPHIHVHREGVAGGFGEIPGLAARVTGSIRSNVEVYKVAAVGALILAAPVGVSPVAHVDGCLKVKESGDKHPFDCVSGCADEESMEKGHTW